MSKRLKIKPIHKRIFGYIGRGDPIDFIAQNIDLRKPNLYKKLHVLEKHGYITIKKLGKILDIQLQPTAIKELSITSVGAQRVNYIRYHDVWISCPILRKPRDWDNDFVEKILEQRSIPFTKHRPNNWKGLFFDYSSFTVRVTPNKIMFNPPVVELSMQNDPDHAKNLITQSTEGVKQRIENLFRISLGKPGKISMTVSSQHVAFVKNQLAKFFVEREINLRVYDHQGRLRVIVDKSPIDGDRDNYEIECVNKAHAEEDAEKLKDLIQDTVLGQFDHKQTQKDLSQASGIIKDIAKNQEFFSKDLVEYGQKIAAHARSIEQLGDGVTRLVNAVEGVEHVRGSKRTHRKQRRITRLQIEEKQRQARLYEPWNR